MKAKTLIVMAACMAIGLCASGCQNSMTQTAVAQEDVVHIQIAYENNPGRLILPVRDGRNCWKNRAAEKFRWNYIRPASSDRNPILLIRKSQEILP